MIPQIILIIIFLLITIFVIVSIIRNKKSTNLWYEEFLSESYTQLNSDEDRRIILHNIKEAYKTSRDSELLKKIMEKYRRLDNIKIREDIITFLSLEHFELNNIKFWYNKILLYDSINNPDDEMTDIYMLATNKYINISIIYQIQQFINQQIIDYDESITTLYKPIITKYENILNPPKNIINIYNRLKSQLKISGIIIPTQQMMDIYNIADKKFKDIELMINIVEFIKDRNVVRDKLADYKRVIDNFNQVTYPDTYMKDIHKLAMDKYQFMMDIINKGTNDLYDIANITVNYPKFAGYISDKVKNIDKMPGIKLYYDLLCILLSGISSIKILHDARDISEQLDELEELENSNELDIKKAKDYIYYYYPILKKYIENYDKFDTSNIIDDKFYDIQKKLLDDKIIGKDIIIHPPQ
jgi:hypothetical protein